MLAHHENDCPILSLLHRSFNKLNSVSRPVSGVALDPP